MNFSLSAVIADLEALASHASELAPAIDILTTVSKDLVEWNTNPSGRQAIITSSINEIAKDLGEMSVPQALTVAAQISTLVEQAFGFLNAVHSTINASTNLTIAPAAPVVEVPAIATEATTEEVTSPLAEDTPAAE